MHLPFVVEADPTGFGLCRELQKQGFACVIIAPSSIARTAKDKAVKTDKSDAQMLAKTLNAIFVSIQNAVIFPTMMILLPMMILSMTKKIMLLFVLLARSFLPAGVLFGN